MEILLVVLTVTFLFFFKIIFFKKEKKEDKKREKLDIEVIEKEEFFYEILEKKEEEKKIILYELNTSPIKLNLYAFDNFSNHKLKKLYEKLTIEMLMIDEPFHTSFFAILKFIDTNNFWIRNPKTSSIIINIRDVNLEKSVHESLKVFDTKDIAIKIIFELLPYVKHNFKPKTKQILLLSCIVFVLAKSQNINMICEDCESEYELSRCIVEKILNQYSGADASEIIPKNNMNYTLIGQLYDRVIHSAREHNNVIKIENDLQDTPRLLENLPKKKLTKINSETNNVLQIVLKV